MLKQSKILFGGLRSLQRELSRKKWTGAKFTILVDENTFQYCLPELVSRIDALQTAEFIELPAGEECKSLEVASQVWQTLLEGGADRSSVLVCLGGGSLCDLGGFVAAGYKRGIRHINVPTTLLAMVDAAIGGKTAVDFGGVKNSIGFFYPADTTIIDPVFLDTLPQVSMLCGEMEMVKTAAVADGELYNTLILEKGDGNIDPTPLNAHIKEVAGIKDRVVRNDPYDYGVRKILNFGHTFGHAMEVYCGLPHGIAVGIGMRVAMYLSMKKTGLAEKVYNTYSQWLDSRLSHTEYQIPHFNLKDVEQMLALMHQDKKCADGEVLCVLLLEPGTAIIDVAVSDNEVRDAMLHLGK